VTGATGGGSGRKKMDCLTPPRIGAIYVIGEARQAKGPARQRETKLQPRKITAGQTLYTVHIICNILYLFVCVHDVHAGGRA
jgi:hypothetical protein